MVEWGAAFEAEHNRRHSRASKELSPLKRTASASEPSLPLNRKKPKTEHAASPGGITDEGMADLSRQGALAKVRALVSFPSASTHAE